MHHFYLQCPLSHKWFDPWDVECLLSLLESWTPTSSVTTFRLAWKTANLLALFTAKCCSDLSLLCVDNHHLFLQHNASIFVPLSGGKTDHVGHLPPRICIASHCNVIIEWILGCDVYSNPHNIKQINKNIQML